MKEFFLTIYYFLFLFLRFKLILFSCTVYMIVLYKKNLIIILSYITLHRSGTVYITCNPENYYLNFMYQQLGHMKNKKEHIYVQVSVLCDAISVKLFC